MYLLRLVIYFHCRLEIWSISVQGYAICTERCTVRFCEYTCSNRIWQVTFINSVLLPVIKLGLIQIIYDQRLTINHTLFISQWNVIHKSWKQNEPYEFSYLAIKDNTRSKISYCLIFIRDLPEHLVVNLKHMSCLIRIRARICVHVCEFYWTEISVIFHTSASIPSSWTFPRRFAHEQTRTYTDKFRMNIIEAISLARKKQTSKLPKMFPILSKLSMELLRR